MGIQRYKQTIVAPSLEATGKGIKGTKQTAAAAAPGVGQGFLRWEAGTNAGTLKLVAYAGTSTTGVTVVDNVGTGN